MSFSGPEIGANVGDCPFSTTTTRELPISCSLNQNVHKKLFLKRVHFGGDPNVNRFSRPETSTSVVDLRCCEEREDKRGMRWGRICEGAGSLTVNRTDRCPANTSGFALWTCDLDTRTFQPPQPDRTHCYPDWLSHVISMVRIEI